MLDRKIDPPPPNLTAEEQIKWVYEQCRIGEELRDQHAEEEVRAFQAEWPISIDCAYRDIWSSGDDWREEPFNDDFVVWAKANLTRDSFKFKDIRYDGTMIGFTSQELLDKFVADFPEDREDY